MYAKIKRYEEARISYQKAVEIKPDLADAYNNLGNISRASNDHEEAIMYFKKAIEVDPNYANAYINLSRIYLYNKQYSLAIEYFDKAKAFGLTDAKLAKELEPYRP